MIKLYKKHDIDGLFNLVIHRQLAMSVISRNVEGKNKHLDLLFDTHTQTISLFIECSGRLGCDAFTTIYAISAYHHGC